GKVSNSDLQIFSSFNAANPNGDVQFISYDLATGGFAYLAEDTSASGNSDRDFNDFSIELTPESDSPTRIPNSNPWINADQTSFLTESDLNPQYLESYKEALIDPSTIPENEEYQLEVALVLNRREVDHTAVEQSGQYSFDNFYDANELLYLSYKDLHEYTEHLSPNDLTELYGADPADLDAVVDFLNRSGARDIDATLAREQRTLKFKIGIQDFVRSFTDGSLLVNFEDENFSYVSKTGDVGRSYLEAQGEGAAPFANSILGIEILSAGRTFQAIYDPDQTSNVRHQISNALLRPLDVASAYQFPGIENPSAGSGARIGLVSSGGTQAMLNWQDSDHFQQYLQMQGRNPLAVPRFESLATGLSDENQNDIVEQMLDISILASVSPGASIIESGYDSSLYRRYASLIYLENPVDVISSSDQDDTNTHEKSRAMDQLYLDAVLRGTSIVIASGDRGIANIDDPSVFLPGRGQTNPTTDTGSAAVLSVGGTAFNRYALIEEENNRTPISAINQLTWNDFNPQTTLTIARDVNVKSGIDAFSMGEFSRASQFFELQAGLTQGIASSGSWQPSSQFIPAGYQRDHLTGLWSDVWRAYPDISMLSGGNRANGTNITYESALFSNGEYTTTQVSGTSAAAPLVAGLIANITAELRSRYGEEASVGFLNPLLYELYASGFGDQVFFDVPAGANNSNVFTSPATPAEWDGIYVGYDDSTEPGNIIFYPLNGTLPNGELDRSLSATAPGFDAATGLGSLNGMGMLNQLITLYPLL
uniref:S8 family serine peptidase n=1 Tax=Synechococcus sp. CB0205 TaxID=232363 RepID=UPI00020031F0